MFKLVVLAAIVAVAAARPGLLHGGGIGIAAVAPAAVALPAAVSSSSRTDIIHPSIAVARVAHVAPAIAVAPAVTAVHAAPLAVGVGHLGLGLGGLGGLGGIGLGHGIGAIGLGGHGIGLH